MEDKIKNILDFHADDYGISKNSTDDILTLLNKGYLNSISILPNMNTFDYSVKLLKEYLKTNPELKITIHLNFMEGHCCANPDDIPDLVDSNGYFKISWGKLFIYNYLPFKHYKIRKQLYIEIVAQAEKCISTGLFDKQQLRFDGHQHTHMIPVVFSAIKKAVIYFEAKNIKTEYIRNTQDPIKPYNKVKELKSTYTKINLIKCLILNFYSFSVRRYLIKKLLPVNYLCGVFFSGHMDFERLNKILNIYSKKPIKQNRPIELLFHPGSVLKEEISEEFVKPDFNIFHLSNGRKIEFDSIIKLHNI